jgi:hypothetical protein
LESIGASLRQRLVAQGILKSTASEEKIVKVEFLNGESSYSKKKQDIKMVRIKAEENGLSNISEKII